MTPSTSPDSSALIRQRLAGAITISNVLFVVIHVGVIPPNAFDFVQVDL
jgi:hypothetical protein